PPHSVSGQCLAFLDQFEQFREDALDQRVVSRPAGNGDLVAPDVHVARDRPLDEPEQLVTRAEQPDHGVRILNRDLRLRPQRLGVWAAHGGGWSLRHGSARGPYATCSHVLPARSPRTGSSWLSGYPMVSGVDHSGPPDFPATAGHGVPAARS